MGCTHPYSDEVMAIRNDADEVIGLRCPACGMTAMLGDSIWRTLLEGLRAFLGLRGRTA